MVLFFFFLKSEEGASSPPFFKDLFIFYAYEYTVDVEMAMSHYVAVGN